MKRTFLTLTMVSLIFLIAAFALGLSVEDPKARDEATQARVSWHINTAMGALVFSALVHAIVLTYLMGTGRWMEETSRSYALPPEMLAEGQRIKYRTIPAMVAVLGLLIATAALGSMADPASPSSGKPSFGIAASTIHLAAAITTVAAHLFVAYWEYIALHRNGELIQQAMAQVRRVRLERGLPV